MEVQSLAWFVVAAFLNTLIVVVALWLGWTFVRSVRGIHAELRQIREFLVSSSGGPTDSSL